MARWLPGIADGLITAALAVAEESGSWDLADIPRRRAEVGRRRAWDCQRHQASTSSTATPPTRCSSSADARRARVLRRGRRPGVGRARLDTLDLTRPLASVALRDARAVRVGVGRDTAAWLSEVTDLVRRAGRRAARRGRALPGTVGRVRQGPRAVRPPDRLVPGRQAQVRHRVPRGRGRPVCGFRGNRGAGSREPTRRSRRPLAYVQSVPPPSPMPPRSASRSTAVSATPGSTTRTCTCGARSRPSSSSDRLRVSAPGWPRWPGSEGRR